MYVTTLGAGLFLLTSFIGLIGGIFGISSKGRADRLERRVKELESKK